MKPLYHFYVLMPDGLSMTWIGGGLRLSKRPGYVWLTKPGGEPVLELPRGHVRPTNPAETIERMREERLLAKAPLN